MGYRNCVDCDKFFVNSNYKNSSKSFCCNHTPVNQSPGLPQIFGSASTIDNTIEAENPNVPNNLPDIDAELDYNDLFSMPSDYYDDHNSVNNLLCSKNKSNHLFMIHFNVRSLQKNIDKLSHSLSDLNHKPDVVAVSETKLKENMIHSNIELDGYQSIHRNSHTSAACTSRKTCIGHTISWCTLVARYAEMANPHIQSFVAQKRKVTLPYDLYKHIMTSCMLLRTLMTL